MRMAWFCASKEVVCATTASMCVILSTKAVWVVAKNADMAEKVRTASIIARKSRADMKICCGGGANVLCPTDAVGAGGIRGAEDADDIGNGAVTAGVADGAIWGSSVSSTGWSTAISPAMS